MRTLSGVVLGLLLGFLVFTNPSMEDFQTFMADKAEHVLREEVGESRFGRVLTDLGAGLTGGLIDNITERKSYGLFSLYTIGRDDPHDDGDAWRYLGIGGMFIQLEKPE